MAFTFDAHGHIPLDKRTFFDAAVADPFALVNDALLRMTPGEFPEYGAYCDFVRDLAECVGVHPRSIVVRGSSLLGFSPCPKRDRIWKPFRATSVAGQLPSDIDVAIIDPAFFERMDREVREWEAAQSNRMDLPSSIWNLFLKRQRHRLDGCLYDRYLPHGVCQAHKDRIGRFGTTRYLQRNHGVTCFLIRDWWAARLRWQIDLRELTDGVAAGNLLRPEDS